MPLPLLVPLILGALKTAATAATTAAPELFMGAGKAALMGAAKAAPLAAKAAPLIAKASPMAASSLPGAVMQVASSAMRGAGGGQPAAPAPAPVVLPAQAAAPQPQMAPEGGPPAAPAPVGGTTGERTTKLPKPEKSTWQKVGDALKNVDSPQVANMLALLGGAIAPSGHWAGRMGPMVSEQIQGRAYGGAMEHLQADVEAGQPATPPGGLGWLSPAAQANISQEARMLRGEVREERQIAKSDIRYENEQQRQALMDRMYMENHNMDQERFDAWKAQYPEEVRREQAKFNNMIEEHNAQMDAAARAKEQNQYEIGRRSIKEKTEEESLEHLRALTTKAKRPDIGTFPVEGGMATFDLQTGKQVSAVIKTVEPTKPEDIKPVADEEINRFMLVKYTSMLPPEARTTLGLGNLAGILPGAERKGLADVYAALDNPALKEQFEIDAAVYAQYGALGIPPQIIDTLGDAKYLLFTDTTDRVDPATGKKMPAFQNLPPLQQREYIYKLSRLRIAERGKTNAARFNALSKSRAVGRKVIK